MNISYFWLPFSMIAFQYIRRHWIVVIFNEFNVLIIVIIAMNYSPLYELPWFKASFNTSDISSLITIIFIDDKNLCRDWCFSIYSTNSWAYSFQSQNVLSSLFKHFSRNGKNILVFLIFSRASIEKPILQHLILLFFKFYPKFVSWVFRIHNHFQSIIIDIKHWYFIVINRFIISN